MQTFLDLAIKERLAAYVVGREHLTHFEDWFLPLAMKVERSGNATAIELAHEIDLRLAEFSDGFWTEDELRGFFRALVSTVDVVSPELPRLSARSAVRHSQIELAKVSL